MRRAELNFERLAFQTSMQEIGGNIGAVYYPAILHRPRGFRNSSLRISAARLAHY
jgi:hypothetical protein